MPDARPSEKIAKLFPQTEPLKDPSREQTNAAKPPEVTAATERQARSSGRADFSRQRRLRKPPRVQAAVAKPVPLPEPRPNIAPVSVKPHQRHLRRYRYADETPVIEPIPELPVPPDASAV